MAAVTEINSLDQIQYKSKFKLFFYIALCFFLFIMAFFNFFPIGDKLKGFIRTKLTGPCNPDYDEIHLEWLLPKIVISDLSLPSSCFNRQGPPIKLAYVTINYQLINFSPIGLPFRVDTMIYGQPLSVYFVQGFGKQMIRLKDQKIVLSRLDALSEGKFKLIGNIMTDLSAVMEGQNISSLSFRAASKDFQIPSQNLSGFNLPTLKLNEFYVEANSLGGSRVAIEKLIVGDTDSPVRANFKGKIDIQTTAVNFSPIDLRGEVAFSESFRQAVPIVDMLFQSFNKKDNFYQIRLGGMLGAPKPSAP
jgi:hypothetical protein